VDLCLCTGVTLVKEYGSYVKILKRFDKVNYLTKKIEAL